MTLESNSRAAKLFEAAIDMASAERASYLDRACKDDKNLRAKVDALLEADGKAEGYLEPPVDQTAIRSDPIEPTEKVRGRRIGKYQLLRVIASGGMGIVYEAMQDNSDRLVALKVLKAGFSSEPALKRFAHEARILGHLRHPGIAQIFEADVQTDIGELPYFVMEYIPEAKTITEHARSADLSIRSELELFSTVCDIVHYGHQQGIIHRDLKPGNILVNLSGHPKIIDFGVARVTDADMTLATQQTSEGQLLGTLKYMSPEQCEGDPTKIDIRCDVYALGVVLFELLTGQLPYDFDTPSPYEIPRVIREQEPLKLSAINRALSGDIETIAFKALEKDRDRRYQSALELGRDIGRYLNNEPIEAKRDSSWYVLKKTFFRYKLAASVISSFVLLVMISALALGIMYRKADKQRIRAEQAQRNAENNAEALRISDYFNTISIAHNAYESANTVLLKVLLDRCHEEMRHFEWFFLKNISDTSFLTLDQHEGSVTSAVFSPDDRWILSGGMNDYTVRTWDASSGELKRTLTGNENIVSSVAFSPKGRLIASGGYDKTVRIWNADTGDALVVLEGHEDVVMSIAFSPDSECIISGDEGGCIRIWNAYTGEEIMKLMAHTEGISALAFSPYVTILASGSEDSTIKLWNIKTWIETFSIEAHDLRVSCLLFSDDGAKLYSSSWDKTIKVWDPDTGNNLRTVVENESEINSFAIAQDRSLMALADITSVQLLDMKSGEKVDRFLGHEHTVNEVRFDSDGSRILSCSHDGTLKIWKTNCVGCISDLGVHEGKVESVACSRDGRWIAAGGRDGLIKLYDAVSRQEIGAFYGHVGGVTSLAFHPNGSKLVSGGMDCIAKIYSIPSGDILKTLSAHKGGIRSVGYSQDGKMVAAGSLDRTLTIWDANTGELTKTIQSDNRVCSVDFSPSGDRIISCGCDKIVTIWDVDTGDKVCELDGHTQFARTARYSPDGVYIVTTGDDRVARIWDAKTFRLLHILKGHQHNVLNAAFSTDTKRIVTSSYDKTLKVWDTATGHLALTLHGHDCPVTSAVFTPDTSKIISGSDDKTVKIWDAGEMR